MLFSVVAMFKPDVEARRQEVHEQFNAHLMQRFMDLKVGGPLYDEAGRRSGVLMLIDGKDIGQVRNFLRGDPYAMADLYEHVEISRLQIEVGRLG